MLRYYCLNSGQHLFEFQYCYV